ncbi:septal ring lytic transglycosylase RlpA family protein [Snodgrassella communis]|uniref:septal ring lytic transglycosylase RlpA family protein n=1 Tax=Snodgrassella communis TaxID=2946699 RepID=UPI0023B2C709|nr:septal ring lytic transglycosylase RlpA family protein [Snodgrassella communis]WMY92053.1 septal ring lytic transglycosylase RlpA family protein [Snodgrassella communis]
MIRIKVLFVSLAMMFGFSMAYAKQSSNLSAPVYHAKKSVSNLKVVPAEHLHKTANLSYQVAGKRYYPLQKVASFSQVGRASYYGQNFQGRRTSSGERFNSQMLTAAHPTLPIPSYARVTNLSNGKAVVVRVNDRGPFHANRVMDLSYAAAQQLGFVRAGTAQVRVEQIVPGERIQPAGTGGNIYVDLQRFGSKEKAQQYLKATSRHLQAAGSQQQTKLVKVNNSYVVRMGPFQQQQRADEAKKSMLTAL